MTAKDNDEEVPPTPTPEAAIRLATFARQKRAIAKTMRDDWGDPTGARFAELDADTMEQRAADGRDPHMHTTGPLTPGRGGEMVAGTKANLTDRPWLVDTVRARPDMIAAEASVKRMELAADANALVLGVDAAETIQAQNSIERMIAHELAAAHHLAMRLAAKAGDFLAHSVSFYPPARQQVQSIEAARLAASAARLMETVQRAALTIERLRNGGRQTVVVQHVNVADGGQAVVAGTVGAKREEPGGQGT